MSGENGSDLTNRLTPAANWFVQMTDRIDIDPELDEQRERQGSAGPIRAIIDLQRHRTTIRQSEGHHGLGTILDQNSRKTRHEICDIAACSTDKFRMGAHRIGHSTFR